MISPLNPVDGGFDNIKLTPDMYSPVDAMAIVSQRGQVTSKVHKLTFYLFHAEMFSWAPSPVPSNFFSCRSSIPFYWSFILLLILEQNRFQMLTILNDTQEDFISEVTEVFNQKLFSLLMQSLSMGSSGSIVGSPGTNIFPEYNCHLLNSIQIVALIFSDFYLGRNRFQTYLFPLS